MLCVKIYAKIYLNIHIISSGSIGLRAKGRLLHTMEHKTWEPPSTDLLLNCISTSTGVLLGVLS